MPDYGVACYVEEGLESGVSMGRASVLRDSWQRETWDGRPQALVRIQGLTFGTSRDSGLNLVPLDGPPTCDESVSIGLQGGLRFQVPE